MPKIVWDATSERFYETGVDHGVLYSPDETGDYASGVAWNGLTAVTEAPSGAEATPLYADNIKYLNLISLEEFGATIEAYTYPDKFAEHDGSVELSPGVTIGQQSRKIFGLSYRTLVGNDIDGNDHAYKLHLVYGALAAPSEKAFATVNDSPEAITFSWEMTTTPVPVTGAKPTALVTLDSRKVDAASLAALEAILYGTETDAARLPLPDEVASIVSGSLTEATPAEVTFDTVTDEITIPTTTGVDYQIDGSTVTGTVGPITEVTMVTAVAQSGYVLASGAPSEWTFDPAV